MKNIKTLALGVVLAATTLWADKYTLDAAHSEVEFAVRHMMISKTKGDFKEYAGVVEFDGKDLNTLKFDVTVKTASIDTKIEKRDEHLKGEDFFDAAKFPEIKFVSTAIKNIKGNSFDVVGKLTIKGVTKEVTIPMTYAGTVTSPWGQTVAGFEGEFAINRTDYGLTWNKALEAGGVVVGEEVTISIQAETIKQ